MTTQFDRREQFHWDEFKQQASVSVDWLVPECLRDTDFMEENKNILIA